MKGFTLVLVAILQASIGLAAASSLSLGQSHELLRAYSALRDLHGLQAAAQMQVPLLALIGVQSSGKTSMVESIVGFPVGFTARGTATRCPVRYILRSASNESYAVNGRPVPDRGALRAAVQTHMEGLGRKFTAEVGVMSSDTSHGPL